MADLPPDVIELDVAAEHIRHGTVGDCSSCPVALALKERFPCFQWDVRGWQAAAYGMHLGAGAGTYHSPEMWNFVNDFDRGRNVQPTRMTLKKLKLY